ncbi:endonuclease VIII [soil metagenome]
MPEGPEVRKFADEVDSVLTGRVIRSFEARTREARNWLVDNGARLFGRRVLSVRSHGKHLVGQIEGPFYFHSHLMMWGRWHTFVPDPPPDIDRRERARVVVEGGAAIMYSGPIFNVGEGEARGHVEHLQMLGPDVLPYEGGFDEAEFRRRLQGPEYRDLTIGAALLNQRIVAGLGNYLRAEVLFACGLNPWTKVGQMKKREVTCLSRIVPELALRSYLFGATASDNDRERMKTDPSLVYQQGRKMGTRHLVFRRTNLPCLRCSRPIKQLRQTTFDDRTLPGSLDRPLSQSPAQAGKGTDAERSRIIYFCAQCQQVEPLPAAASAVVGSTPK